MSIWNLGGLLGGGSKNTTTTTKTSFSPEQKADWKFASPIRNNALLALAQGSGLKQVTDPVSGAVSWSVDENYKPYSGAEEQSIINSGFRSQASTIEAAKRNKIQQLLALGFQPAQAESMAGGWAGDQTMKSRLEGEADLMNRSLSQQYDRMVNLLQLANSMVPGTSSPAISKSAVSEPNDIWGQLGNLAQLYGAYTA